MKIGKYFLMLAAAMLLGSLQLPARAAGDATEFFVAPDGNDNWQGTKDRPLATLERARDKVRELKKSAAGLKAPIRVVLRGGDYTLQNTFTLTAEDSGTEQNTIVYTAGPGENPVISGGRLIRNWQPGKINNHDAWVADLAAQGLKDASFKELFVGGARRSRPRLPREGFFRFDTANLKDNYQKRIPAARFVKGDLKAWSNLGDVELIYLNRWVDIHTLLSRVDESSSTVYFARPQWEVFDSKNLPCRYWVENVKEALEAPGEWYLDRPAAKLYYLPLPGETPDKTPVIAPVLPALVQLGDKNAKVQHVRFEHLTFRHAEAEVKQSADQAAATVSGAILLRGAASCVFYDCNVDHVGGYAIQVEPPSSDCRIIACSLEDLGAGGVRIDGGSSHTVVSDCAIRRGGRVWMQACAILAMNSGWNRIVHNHIANFYYTGISCGWTWGYGPTATVDNRIEYNRIHDLGNGGLLEDMGGIYMLGAQPGGVLRGNVIHDVSTYDYGAWGLYTDEGSAYLLLEGNLAYRCAKGGFHQHYGRDNVLRNNIFALGADQGLQKTRAEAIRPFIFEKNITLLAPEAKLLYGNWSDGHFLMRDNLYWREGERPINFAGKSFEEWQKLGHDAGSAIADPDFIDPTGGDFTLAPWSPAPAKGFKPIDASQAGPRLLDSGTVAYEKWPQPDETPKVILEGRLEPDERRGKNGGGRFDKPIVLSADKPVTVTYELVNRGSLPGKGEVEFHLEPGGAATLEGNPVLKYELKPGEKVEAHFKILASPASKTPKCRLEGNAKGEGLVSTALFFN